MGHRSSRLVRLAAIAAGCALLIPTTTHAQSITTVQENGRKVYVNDDTTLATRDRSVQPRVRLVQYVYWSNTEHRWKPVPAPSANALKAARSAVAEVHQFVSAQPLTRVDLESNGAVKVDPNYKQLAQGRVVTSAAIDKAIEDAAAKHNVDPNLVRALVKVESNFNPSAVSRKGAMGLMQLMPATAKELKVSNPFDPAQNVDAGVRHLKGLLNNFNGDVSLSLAAYNAGQGAVQRNRGVPPYAETRNYVRRITSLYGGGSSPFQLSGPIAAPIHVTRDGRGILNISNTE
jgi:soluble lytic murein transglycosylase-like protein